MPLATSALDGLVTDLRNVAGDRVSTANAVREHHSPGESWHDAAPPDVMVFPGSTDEVSRLVAACAAHGVPIIPFGIGNSSRVTSTPSAVACRSI
jgi:D-lactate dehydrogenase (cytochrome)